MSMDSLIEQAKQEDFEDFAIELKQCLQNAQVSQAVCGISTLGTTLSKIKNVPKETLIGICNVLVEWVIERRDGPNALLLSHVGRLTFGFYFFVQLCCSLEEYDTCIKCMDVLLPLLNVEEPTDYIKSVCKCFHKLSLEAIQSSSSPSISPNTLIRFVICCFKVASIYGDPKQLLSSVDYLLEVILQRSSETDVITHAMSYLRQRLLVACNTVKRSDYSHSGDLAQRLEKFGIDGLKTLCFSIKLGSHQNRSEILGFWGKLFREEVSQLKVAGVNSTAEVVGCTADVLRLSLRIEDGESNEALKSSCEKLKTIYKAKEKGEFDTPAHSLHNVVIKFYVPTLNEWLKEDKLSLDELLLIQEGLWQIGALFRDIGCSKSHVGCRWGCLFTTHLLSVADRWTRNESSAKERLTLLWPHLYQRCQQVLQLSNFLAGKQCTCTPFYRSFCCYIQNLGVAYAMQGFYKECCKMWPIWIRIFCFETKDIQDAINFKVFRYISNCFDRDKQHRASSAALVCALACCPSELQETVENWVKKTKSRALSNVEATHTIAKEIRLLNNDSQPFKVEGLLLKAIKQLNIVECSEAEVIAYKKNSDFNWRNAVLEVMQDLAEIGVKPSDGMYALALKTEAMYKFPRSSDDSCVLLEELENEYCIDDVKSTTQCAHMVALIAWTYIYKLRILQEEADKQMEEKKIVPLTVKEVAPGEEPPQDDGVIMPTYTYLTLINEHKRMQPLYRVLDLLEAFKNKFEEDEAMLLEHVLLVVQIISLSGHSVETIRGWRLLFYLAIKFDDRTIMATAASELLRHVPGLSEEKIKNIDSILESKNQIPRWCLLRYKVWRVAADVTLEKLDGARDRINNIITELMQMSQTKMVLWALADACMVAARIVLIPGEDVEMKSAGSYIKKMLKLFTNVYATIKKEVADGKNVKSSISFGALNNLIRGTVFASRMWLDMGDPGTARMYLKKQLIAVQKMGLALRSSELLTVLIDADLLCENLEEARIKFEGLRYIFSENNDDFIEEAMSRLAIKKEETAPALHNLVPKINLEVETSREANPDKAMVISSEEYLNSPMILKPRLTEPFLLSHPLSCKCKLCSEPAVVATALRSLVQQLRNTEPQENMIVRVQTLYNNETKWIRRLWKEVKQLTGKKSHLKEEVIFGRSNTCPVELTHLEVVNRLQLDYLHFLLYKVKKYYETDKDKQARLCLKEFYSKVSKISFPDIMIHTEAFCLRQLIEVEQQQQENEEVEDIVYGSPQFLSLKTPLKCGKLLDIISAKKLAPVRQRICPALEVKDENDPNRVLEFNASPCPPPTTKSKQTQGKENAKPQAKGKKKAVYEDKESDRRPQTRRTTRRRLLLDAR